MNPRSATASGPSEGGYWDLRPDGAPDPAEDPTERFLLTHARILDAADTERARGAAALIVEWQLPVLGDDLDVRAAELEALLEGPAIVLGAAVADHEERQVHGRCLVSAPAQESAEEVVGHLTARIRAQMDCPGSRLRPPRLIRTL